MFILVPLVSEAVDGAYKKYYHFFATNVKAIYWLFKPVGFEEVC
jgi:hypothetical protein